MIKGPSKGWAAVGKATKALAHQDQETRAEAERDREQSQRSTASVSEIKPRLQGDTRQVDAYHVLDLAESISALGLLEPLVVDRHLHLLAGAHRWEASRLLAITSPDERVLAWRTLAGLTEVKHQQSAELSDALDRVRLLTPLSEQAHIPVRIVDFDAESDKDRALSIEIAENEKRRDYTKREVTALAERLKVAGFRMARGKPKVGERAMGPALAVIIGKSERTVRRLLGGEVDPEGVDNRSQDEKSLRPLLTAINKFEKIIADGPQGKKMKGLLELTNQVKDQILKVLNIKAGE